MAAGSIQTNLWRPYRTGSAVRNVPAAQTEVELTAGRLWRLAGDHRWRLIICRQGELWITQERDLQDYLLRPGDVFIITQPGLLLVQAREDAYFQLSPPLTTAQFTGDSAAAIFQ